MKPSIYVITAYRFNHGSENPSAKPLDPRFLQSDKNYIYYLIDQEVPSALKGKNVLLEKEIDPLLAEAGKRHFAEWAFLLAEAKHSFCTYPLFTISSRFYEKNRWLTKDLNTQWDELFSYFDKYGWGFLPSYDRPLRWINLEWKKDLKKEVWRYKFFPVTEKTYPLTEEIFGVKIPEDYSFSSDFLCNYIGFRSRQELLDYVNFYKPLIDYFFDENYNPKRDIAPYIRNTGCFRNEKPFTFFPELLCHLFFFKTNQKAFALHYDGHFEIDEKNKIYKRIGGEKRPLSTQMKTLLRWQWRRIKTEGVLAPIFSKLNAKG